jgi:CubicO group peptidase (beta-lactamase class C family)
MLISFFKSRVLGFDTLMFALFLVCLGALSFASPSIGASSLERLLAVASKRSSQRSGSSCSPPLKPVPLDANSVDFSSVSDVLRSSFLFGGVVMGASSFGELVFNTSFGVANTNTPWTLDTISRIGSVTKVLTSVLAFQTAEMGLISLDGTKFADLFPGTLLLTPDLQPGAEKVVSVRSILGQGFVCLFVFVLVCFIRASSLKVSGLPREPPFGVSNVSNADASVYLNATRLVLAPNERPSYSNLGFGVVGRGLERVLQQSFEDAIETQIFGPAKMKRSGSEYTTEVVQAMAARFFFLFFLQECCSFDVFCQFCNQRSCQAGAQSWLGKSRWPSLQHRVRFTGAWELSFDGRRAAWICVAI